MTDQKREILKAVSDIIEQAMEIRRMIDTCEYFLFEKPARSITRIFIHCSANDSPKNDDVSVMDRWHKARGWSGVGYHFYIKKDGEVQIGRDIEKSPAAQKGNNTGTIAICLGGLKLDLFTDAQFSSLKSMCHSMNGAFNGKVTFHGHNEVSSKSCPVFNYRKILGLDKNGYMT